MDAARRSFREPNSPNHGQVTVTDTLSYLALTRQTVDLLMAFFYVVAIVASLLCFFMLFTTFEVRNRPRGTSIFLLVYT